MTTLNTQSAWVAALVLPTLFACRLYAVDGVVLINQSSALAGNVTPGDIPGFPVTISVSGSYRLTGNLTVPDPNTNVIEIKADNVSIDLNGFSILGPTVCSGPPISCSPTGTGNGIFSFNSHIAVRNGNIHGMGSSGVTLDGFENMLEKIAVSSNGSTGISSSGGVITSCTADFNGGDGIHAVGGTVSGNVAIENGKNGIALSFQGVVLNNQADHNGTNGIIENSDPFGKGSVFSGNSATFNGGIGIGAVCPSLIAGNSAFGNPGDNIFTNGSGCVLANNAAP